MRRITFSSVIVLMLVVMVLIATNLPPARAQPDPLTLECLASTNTTKVGQAINWTACSAGGSPPYSWNWTVDDVEQSWFGDTVCTNFTYTFNETGNYTVCINVTDSSNNWKQCCTDVTVTQALSLTCNITPNPTKVGHVTNFTATASGGAGNYSWLWTIDGTPVGLMGQNITHNFTIAGNYTVCVNVTDSSLNWTQCCTNVTVNRRLTMECDVSTNTTRVGDAINWTACADRGVRPYSWSWTMDGEPLVSLNDTACTNFTYTFNETGAYEVCVNVTDVLDNEYQCCTNVTVSEALNLTCDVTPNPTKVGHVTNFTANATGGVGNYSWLWTVNGIPGPTTQNATYNFTGDGIYTVCINVTDSSGNWTQCCTNVTVNPRLTMECLASDNTTKVDQAINWTACAAGGVGNYSWSWMVDDVEEASFNDTACTNFTYTFNTTGNYNVCVNVTDSLENKERCCTNVTVSEALNLTCDVSPNPTKVGHETNFTANATGGVGNYSWLWTVNGIPGPTTQNATYNFTGDGIYNVCVNVTDSLDNKEQCCTNVTVNPRLTMECLASDNTTKVDQAINWTACAAGGVGNYSWSWMVDDVEEASFNDTACTNFTYTFNTTGNYNVCVNVTDSLENKERCCTNVTVVAPAPYRLVLLPATDTNLVGTTHSLTATVYDQFNNVMEGVNLTWGISGVGSFSGTPESPTDVSGQADAVITSNVAGISTVRCEVANNTSVFDTATKTWTVKVPPRGGGGGGCPPINYLTVDWDGNNVTQRLLGNDELSVDLLGLSPDGCHSLLLEQGTHAPTVGEITYYLIVIRELELEDVPFLPENTVAIVAVNITPEDAVFNKDIILLLCFDQLPDNALDTAINYYNDVSGVWVPLESTLGELDGMLTVSAMLRHFTIFAVLSELAPPSPPPPAHFVASGLNIESSVEKIWESVTFVTKTGESVTITANVANDGGQEGTYTVELKLDGETVDTEIVTLGAGQSRQVSFTLSEMDYGQHEVEIDGLSGEFTTSRTITWWLIIVIIVAIGLIIWGVIWFRRRRKARQAA